MSEINNNFSSSLSRKNASSATSSEGPSRREINSLAGLGSGLDTQTMVSQLVAVEKKRLAPVISRKEDAQVELEAYNIIQQNLENIKATAEGLSKSSLWEGKIVETSNEEVITAIATSGAKPGKNTLVIEKLALNHQLASQGFEEQDALIGVGNVKISVGEEISFNVVIDETNNTLVGLKDALNQASDDVRASIIKTGSKVRPYQLVLTSQTTGSPGRITPQVDLKGNEIPSFSNEVDSISSWRGVGEPVSEVVERPKGTGASTAVVRVIGEYGGEVDREFSFTAIQSGIIGGENTVQLRWKDDTGRSGTLELDSFNYSPGEPITFVDGLSLMISQGEVVVGDEFSFKTRAAKSDVYWWLGETEKAAAFTQPTPWKRQATEGAPEIEGTYTGTDDLDFTITVEGSGQVGSGSTLRVRWESSDGDGGSFRVGQGYEPGTPLAIKDGLTLSIKPGVLNDRQFSTFSAKASGQTLDFWNPEAERFIPSEVLDVTNWQDAPLDPDQVEVFSPEFPEELGPRISSSEVLIEGSFEGDEAKSYNFTALKDGTIGTTKDLQIRWSDNLGNTGVLNVSDDYPPGMPLELDSGLYISFGEGRVFAEDGFTVRTRTPTIQPPQDAVVRFGATEFGGGLEITSPTNELNSVIEGLKLKLNSTSEKPVTITVKGDTERAYEEVLAFVENYNTLSAVIAELTKYDKDNNVAGPLLGDRELATLQNRLSQLMINPVAGLPADRNMLITLGIKLNNQGMLEVDEGTLRSKIDEDFGSVADMFRTRGSSDNSGIGVVGLGEGTEVSAEGYAVEIEQVATRAEFRSDILPSVIPIDVQNNKFTINVDGRDSEIIELESRNYTPSDYAKALQNAITNDNVVGSRGVRVLLEDNTLRVMSGRYGASGNISFAAAGEATEAAWGLKGGRFIVGQDVQGTIGGEAADGIGQVLKGQPTSEKISDLRLYVTLSEKQLSETAVEGRVKVTKGIGTRMVGYFEKLSDPKNGSLSRITNNLRQQIKDLDTQLEDMNQRIESKRSRLQDKFARLESQMATLKSQQSFMQGQLGSLPSMGGKK